MTDYTIPPNVLDEMIRQQEDQLQYLLSLRGQYYNPTTHLCKRVGIRKKYLAYGLALQGGFSVNEIAKRVDVSRATIHRYWPEVVRATKRR